MKPFFHPRAFCGALAVSWMMLQAAGGAQTPEKKPGEGAVAGKDFTHSAGIEMVWVPEGKFWIGRGEVTGKQFHAVMADGQAGEDKPMEDITAAQAREFCLKLKGQEKAPAAAFALPTIAQWQQAKAKGEALGLKGMNDELHEWTSNVHGDGLSPSFPQSPLIKKPVGKDYPVAMTSRGPLTLEPNTTSKVTLRALTKSVVLWSGRLGFRVVLVPKP